MMDIPDGSTFRPPSEKYGQAIIRITDPSDTLNQLELFYRKKYKDKDGNLVAYGKPMMNEEGIHTIMGMLHSFVNRVVIFSKTDEREITLTVRLFVIALVKELMVSRVRFEIESDGDRTVIAYTSALIAFYCAKRSQDANEKKTWMKMVQEINTKFESNQKDNGPMGKIMGMFNK